MQTSCHLARPDFVLEPALFYVLQDQLADKGSNMDDNAAHYQQERYWQELTQLKSAIVYLSHYELESHRIENFLGMSSAVASSTSIAAWAIWQQWQFVWGSIIATSQVLSAIKRFLPYSRRLKAVVSLNSELSSLLIFAEKNWYDVAQGSLPDDEIHKLIMEIKDRRSKAIQGKLKDTPLPERRKFRVLAETATQRYFQNFYNFRRA